MSFFVDFFNKKNASIDVVSFYNRKWKSFSMKFHSHSRIEIMYIKHGRCTVEIPKQSYRLRERQVIILDANLPHRLIVEDNCHIQNVELGYVGNDCCLKSGDFAFKSGICNQYANGVIVLHDTKFVDSIITGLLNELFASNKILINLYLKLLLYKLDEIIISEHNDSSQCNYVEKVIEYINDNYSENFTMDDIAKHLCLSKVYIHKLFKQKMGKTIIGYATDIRINKAKELLTSTDIPIIDICFQVGINSRQYFSSVFKNVTGMSPKLYKQAMNNKYQFDDRTGFDVVYSNDFMRG